MNCINILFNIVFVTLLVLHGAPSCIAVGSLGLSVRAQAGVLICIPFQLGNGSIFINWGEGNVTFVGPPNSTTTCRSGATGVPGVSYAYPSSSVYAINITGEMDLFGTKDTVAFRWGGTLQSVDFRSSNGMRLASLAGAFSGATSNFRISGDIPLGVTDISYMFRGTTGFDGNGIATWNTDSVTTMEGMFSGATNFSGDVSLWKVSGSSPVQFHLQPMPNVFAAVRNMRGMFAQADRFNVPLGQWDVSSVVDMSSMFASSILFNQDLSTWNLSSVTTTADMFSGASRFNQPLNTWRPSKVRNMANMFSSAPAFNQPLNLWDVSSCTDLSGMFSLAFAFNQPLDSWNVSSVVNFASMFSSARAFNQPLNAWNTSSATSMSGMFDQALRFNQPLDRWDVSRVTSFSSMFWASAFNGLIGSWNTSSATTMAAMFFLSPFNRPIGQWDVSRVRDMQNMFMGCPSFNQPIGTWNTRSVTSMRSMFEGAQAFNQPIGNWNVSRVFDMISMFQSTLSFNQPIGDWNVSAVIRMNQTFFNATKFNQSLTSWCVRRIPSYPTFFSNDSALSLSYLPVWGTCPVSPVPSAAPVPVAPPSTVVIVVDGCQLFQNCPNAPIAPTTGPPLAQQAAPTKAAETPAVAPPTPTTQQNIVAIPSNTSFLLVGNATMPPNTVIVFQVSSGASGSLSAGSITTNSCLNLTGGQLQLSLESSVVSNIQNGSSVELIASTRPECFAENLPPAVGVQTSGCTPLTVTGTKRVDQYLGRVSLSVILNVASVPNACVPPDGAATVDSQFPIAAVAGSIAAAFAIALAIAITVFLLRRRKFDSAKKDVAARLVQSPLA